MIRLSTECFDDPTTWLAQRRCLFNDKMHNNQGLSWDGEEIEAEKVERDIVY